MVGVSTSNTGFVTLRDMNPGTLETTPMLSARLTLPKAREMQKAINEVVEQLETNATPGFYRA